MVADRIVGMGRGLFLHMADMQHAMNERHGRKWREHRELDRTNRTRHESLDRYDTQEL